jgi:hypothetical protein
MTVCDESENLLSADHHSELAVAGYTGDGTLNGTGCNATGEKVLFLCCELLFLNVWLQRSCLLFCRLCRLKAVTCLCL